MATPPDQTYYLSSTMSCFQSSMISTDEFAGESQALRTYLTPFVDSWAATIASWIGSDRELLFLAPGTAPPISAKKVLDWGLERRCRYLFCLGDAPVAYAELNEMPASANQHWIGHFLLDPAHRGRGLGIRFAQALVSRAFVELGAADVLLVVFPENTVAIHCYERAGLVVLGKEQKSFESTGRRHVFLRMGINRARYQRLAHRGRLLAKPLPVATELDMRLNRNE